MQAACPFVPSITSFLGSILQNGQFADFDFVILKGPKSGWGLAAAGPKEDAREGFMVTL